MACHPAENCFVALDQQVRDVIQPDYRRRYFNRFDDVKLALERFENSLFCGEFVRIQIIGGNTREIQRDILQPGIDRYPECDFFRGGEFGTDAVPVEAHLGTHLHRQDHHHRLVVERRLHTGLGAHAHLVDRGFNLPPIGPTTPVGNGREGQHTFRFGAALSPANALDRAQIGVANRLDACIALQVDAIGFTDAQVGMRISQRREQSHGGDDRIRITVQNIDPTLSIDPCKQVNRASPNGGVVCMNKVERINPPDRIRAGRPTQNGCGEHVGAGIGRRHRARGEIDITAVVADGRGAHVDRRQRGRINAAAS